MLTSKQIKEIREHLERAQNPIFYYDNDADGLCSYVILRRFLGRGKGVAVRSFPDLDAGYARKARELNADYVFVLDKPVLSKEFVGEIAGLGLPLVWIDHHDLPIEDFESELENFYVYNPARNSGKEKSDEPVTYLSYRITDRKEDVWLGIIGCIADHHLPDFVKRFKEHYPEFWKDGEIKDPFEAYYTTEIGNIARALNFGLKDSVTHVVQLQNYLVSCKGPVDVFMEVYSNYSFRRKYSDVKKKYDALIEKAKRFAEEDLVFFEYSGELSISADIANELSFIFPDKYIVVAYKKGSAANLSMRGKNVKGVLENVFKEVEGSGVGHEDAVGARIKTEDLGKFKAVLKREIEK
ncbi:MAG: hypothetical protein KKD94_02405 [Nanoarchaeota archaeon]|nr:hypothetical protein [Nanoarchaeota archaeon]MBU1988309.1 hypothetical protein [Nanoarchaeota archaeon]